MSMDLKDPKTLAKAVEALTTSGVAELDEKELKKVKKICKSTPESIPFLYDVVMVQLKKKHSEIRLSTFQLIIEIFQRSHAFREKIVNNLQEILELSMDISGQLPLPKAARERLKKLSLETMKDWVQKFGEGYKKLSLAYNYLKQVKKVDFNDMEARSALERQVEEEKSKKMNNIWKERVKRITGEMRDAQGDIQDCCTQLKSCFELLLPTLKNFDYAGDIDLEADQSEDFANSRVHGLAQSSRQAIQVEVGASSGQKLIPTDENEAIIENLRDQHTILDHKLLPMAKAWCVTLAKAGDICDSDSLKKAIDVKQILEEMDSKAKDLGVDLKGKNQDNSDSDTDDDDFVEVEPKPDFEASVLYEPQDLIQVATRDPQPSTSGTQKTQSTWTLLQEDQADDPTTAAATLTKLKAHIRPSNLPKIDPSLRKDVPVLPYDVDLYNWGEEIKPQKVIIDNEKLRFWGGSGRDDDEMVIPGSDAAMRERSIAFTGSFEPVQWSCRAPLATGRLCPRKDRVKCPLHGKIIPRDNMGNPSNLADKLALEKIAQDKMAANPDWQDPQLLQDIKASTGKDLRIVRKGDKKKQKRKFPGLTDIGAIENNTRARLEKKIFNRSSMKRVANRNTDCHTLVGESVIPLKELENEGEWLDKKKIFFLETSGRDHLQNRQCCAIESAVKHAGDLDVLVVMVADHLDLSANNATRQLYQGLGNSGKLHFRKVNVETIFQDTPLQEVFESGRLAASPHPIVHLSDALRLVLIEKFGGWYSDLDIIFLDKVHDMENVIGSDQLSRVQQQRDPNALGDVVSNAIFHFEAGHPIIKLAVQAFSRSFDGKWSSGGPNLLNKVILFLCQSPRIDSDINEKCEKMKVKVNVVKPYIFYPFGWFDAQDLVANLTEEEWIERFKASKVAHFYQSSANRKSKMLKRRFYGKAYPGLLYLAQNYCPISLHADKTF
eukprot:TCALIF_06890-PA protein Name:"Similar to uvssa UV-stimulated scaffold protein A (Danio rerio)" AED:0.18 eAED:0.18 QI:313/0.75/0.2/1/1/1/5/0/946